MVFFFGLFAFSRAASHGIWRFPSYGSNWSYSRRPTPETQQCGIRAASSTHTTAPGNAGSSTHWARPGIEPATSCFLVWFVNHRATMGTPRVTLFIVNNCNEYNYSDNNIDTSSLDNTSWNKRGAYMTWFWRSYCKNEKACTPWTWNSILKKLPYRNSLILSLYLHTHTQMFVTVLLVKEKGWINLNVHQQGIS